MTPRPWARWAKGQRGQHEEVTRRDSHLADQSAELCGAQVSIDATENRNGDHDITQDAAQIVKRVDTDCKDRLHETRGHSCTLRGVGSQAGLSYFPDPHSSEAIHCRGGGSPSTEK